MRTVPPTEKGKYRAIASGAIANGKPVIVNSNGTVTAIASSGSSSSVGSETQFESGAVEQMNYGGAFDSNNNRVVFVYKDDSNSDYGTAVAGTVSGTSITFGTPVVYSSINTDRNAATFCGGSVNKVVIAYYKNNVDTTHTRVVNTSSSDNSITLGTDTQITSTAGVNHMDLTFDSDSDKVAYFYNHSADGNYIMGSVAGNGDITLGSEATFTTNSPTFTTCTFDSNSNRTVVFFSDDSDSENLKCRVGSTSGTTLSFGSITAVASDRSGGNSVAFDSNSNKVVVVYNDKGNSDYGTAVVGTISGTSISFGTPVVFVSGAVSEATKRPTIAFDTTNNKIGIAFENSSQLKFITATVSDTSITFDTAFTVDSNGATEIIKGVYDSNADKFVVGYKKVSGSTGQARVVQIDTFSTNLTSTENYIGIATGGSYADGQSMTVDVIGTVNDDQSSLTAGQQYFVQKDGTLGLTADTPSVFAGTAISATELIVKE